MFADLSRLEHFKTKVLVFPMVRLFSSKFFSDQYVRDSAKFIL